MKLPAQSRLSSRTFRTFVLTLMLVIGAGCEHKRRTGLLGEGAIDNDQPPAAVAIGKIAPGGTILVGGAVSGFGTDQFDSFLVTADRDTMVTVTVTASSPANADLDFFVAELAGTVSQIASTNNAGNESGSFQLTAGQSAVVAVHGFSDSSYRLSLSGTTP